MEGIGKDIVYRNEIFKKILSLIPTECLEFCYTCLSNFLFISQNFKMIFNSLWKCSRRTVIADNTLVLYFKVRKNLEF